MFLSHGTIQEHSIQIFTEFLNFKSEHPLEHKSAVINALTHRANLLLRDENKKRTELKHIQNVLTFDFKWLSKLAIKPEIKNQVRSSICYTRISQCCRNSQYWDTSVYSKAFRKIKINFTKSWNLNCVQTPSKAWWSTKFIQGCNKTWITARGHLQNKLQ